MYYNVVTKCALNIYLILENNNFDNIISMEENNNASKQVEPPEPGY